MFAPNYFQLVQLSTCRFLRTANLQVGFPSSRCHSFNDYFFSDICAVIFLVFHYPTSAFSFPSRDTDSHSKIAISTALKDLENSPG